MPTRRRRRADTFESFAVKFLLCSPCTLGRAWTDSKKNELEKNAQNALDALPLTKEAKDAGFKLMTGGLVAQRGFFRAIADSLKAAAYDGTEPHPDDKTAAAIVRALQQMDQLRDLARGSERQRKRRPAGRAGRKEKGR